ncbi:PREDICTED: QWRF motif-containing protein 3-like [Nelumbo nucifera]|uniref:QWRF motif-containing protein 3-like n=2 Tax=Nelumbo nucifera TaxID=4432 RepID=A0A1U8BAP2_NELNU|nr:PREDICTED: QWRF motif-containing protein 3-like [Nelumbo nucifera]DAD20807.1 TPA_asm: hypothetical protein HUJ06_022270 [Nelumbo nucifera]
MKNQNTASDHSPKPRRLKSREVSSRFLSPPSTASTEPGIPSPNQVTLSPLRLTTGSAADVRKHRNVDETALIRGLWSSSNTSQSLGKKSSTLADHLGNERLKNLIEGRNSDGSSANNNSLHLAKQRSCSEISRFENENMNSKENHHPITGGPMRCTGRSRCTGKTCSNASSSNSSLVPGRLSIDENALDRRSRRSSNSFIDVLDSESECSEAFSSTDFGSPTTGRKSSLSSSNSSYLSSTASSKRSGMKVSSRYLHNSSTRQQQGTTNSNISKQLPKAAMIRRANSLNSHETSTWQWAFSPGRSLMETKGKASSSSSPKPLDNSFKTNRVNSFFNLFKSKRSTPSCSSSIGPSGITETAHQFRLLHNRLIQWRYVNAKTDAMNRKRTSQAERNLSNVYSSLSKLQFSVAQKRIELQKEKLELKLNEILSSQIKLLEAWGELESHYLLAFSMTKDCLHSVLCRVPLVEGAKVDLGSTSLEIGHATDLALSTQTMLTNYSPMAQETASLLSDLAKVVSGEKALLVECFELLEAVSELEIQERYLRCNSVQLRSLQRQEHNQQLQQDIVI